MIWLCRLRGAFLFLVLMGGGGRGSVDAMPHLELSKTGAMEESYQLDPSVLGNLKGGSAPEGQKKAGMKVQISRKHAQIAEITLGTPPQKLRCLIDSGSSDLWVPSMRCQRCMNTNYFNADASSTFKAVMRQTAFGPKPQAMEISYGSGKVIGYAVIDAMGFGSATVPDQAFIIVEDAALPQGRAWDGICGLGWKALSQFGPTFYENLQRQGRKAIFAIVPAAAPAAFPGATGSAHMLIGDLPEAVYEPGTLAWTTAQPFDPTGGHLNGERTFWVIDGGLQINSPEPVAARFLVDTGTNQVLLVPMRYYQSFIRSLIPPATFDQRCGHDPGAGVVCDCAIEQQSDLKPLKMTFGGRVFTLPVSEMFVRAQAVGGGELCLLTVQPNDMMGSGTASIGRAIQGLLGALFGPNQVSSNSVIPSESGPVNIPGYPFSLSRAAGVVAQGLEADPNGVGAAINTTDYTGGRVCRSSTIIHKGELKSREGPLCDEAPRDLQAEPQSQVPPPPPWNSVLNNIRAALTHGAPQTQVQPADGTPLYGGGILDPPVEPSAQDEPWMIGGIFLEHFVTVFDFDNGRLGFAEPRRSRRLDELHV